MFRTLARRAAIALTLVLTLAAPAAAQLQDPYILRGVQAVLARTGEEVTEGAVNRLYNTLMQVVGASARSLSHPRAISAAYTAEIGGIMVESPHVRNAVLEFLATTPRASVAAVERYAAEFTGRGTAALAETVGSRVPAEFTDEVLRIAYELSDDTARVALRTAVQTEARAGLAEAARRALGGFLSRIGSAFGSAMEWLSTKTAQRLMAAYAIADFTQGHINDALYAYQDEMEALGDAAEIEAFNNNLNLMLDSLEDGRTVLVDGMTLSEAVRQLRRNMNLGGSYFDNILVRVEPEASGGGTDTGGGHGDYDCYWNEARTVCRCGGEIETNDMACDFAEDLRRAFGTIFEDYNSPPDLSGSGN